MFLKQVCAQANRWCFQEPDFPAQTSNGCSLAWKVGGFCAIIFWRDKNEVQYGTANNVKIGLWFLNNNLPTFENVNLLHQYSLFSCLEQRGGANPGAPEPEYEGPEPMIRGIFVTRIPVNEVEFLDTITNDPCGF